MSSVNDPLLVPAEYLEMQEVFFTLSSSAEEPAVMGTYLIEFRWFLINGCRQGRKLWPSLGTAHVMYRVTFVKLWETGLESLFRYKEIFPSL